MPYMERTTGTITTTQTDAAAVDEVQTIDLGDFGAADTFTLTHGGTTTSAITYASDISADINTQLELLASIGSGGVSVSRTSATVYVVTFDGTNTQGKQMGAITITGATGFTPTGVTETTPGQSAKTVTLPLGASIAEVRRVRAGLFEDASTNDLTITDANGTTIFSVANIDTNVSGALYDAFLGVDGVDQAGNAAANVLEGVFESPATIVVKTDAPAAEGSVVLYTKGGYGSSPIVRKRRTGTITTDASGNATSQIRLAGPLAAVKGVEVTGFDSSTDYTITDAEGATVWSKTAIDATTAYRSALGHDGLDQAGNAAADTIEGVFVSPLTVTIANGGNATSGVVAVLTEG